MSDTQIQLALDAPEIVCARVSADQKLRVARPFTASTRSSRLRVTA